LARIHGTEEDRVNCPFYFKIGACRHGDRCSRQHHKPPFSQTVLLKHMWVNPQAAVAAAGGDVSALDPKKLQEDFDEYYEEVVHCSPCKDGVALGAVHPFLLVVGACLRVVTLT
jgi:splicing factor U2AF subunit